MPRVFDVRDLGRTDYLDALAVQRELRDAVRAGTSGSTLLLTEHNPVFTLGRNHPIPDLKVPAESIAARGIPIVQTERGGDITYHGPGQLVAYGIIDLRAWSLGAVDYVDALETTVLSVLADWGIGGEARRDARGMWVGGRKIASVGIHVRGSVTLHGVALNVEPDLSPFELINPCGMAAVAMTSMALERTPSPPLAEVAAAFVDAFATTLRADRVNRDQSAVAINRYD